MIFKYAPYSYSKIDTYRNCPRKFKYSYIDKIKYESIPSVALIRGKYFHDTVECELQGRKSSFEIEDDLKSDVDSLYERFVTSGLGKKYLREDFVPFGIEVPFALNKSFKATQYKSESSIIRGYIDCIFKRDDEYHICDWKTGKYKDLQWQSFDQVKLYSIWLFDILPSINKITCSYVYPEANEENSLTFMREYRKVSCNFFVKAINDIETATEFPKKESKLCDYCDFKTLGICI